LELGAIERDQLLRWSSICGDDTRGLTVVCSARSRHCTGHLQRTVQALLCLEVGGMRRDEPLVAAEAPRHPRFATCQSAQTTVVDQQLQEEPTAKGMGQYLLGTKLYRRHTDLDSVGYGLQNSKVSKLRAAMS